MNSLVSQLWRVIYNYRGIPDEPQAKRSRMKRKCNRRSTTAGTGEESHLESDKKNSILVRAYSRQGDDTHLSKAKVEMDSTGNLVVEHVAEKLKLTGILHVSSLM